MYPLKRAGVGMHHFFQSTLLTFTLLNKQWINPEEKQKAIWKLCQKHPRKGIQIFIWKWLVTTIIVGWWTINSCRGECFKSGRMKGLIMLTIVVNAIVPQEEMVTVITRFYYVFESTEFPRPGMCTTQNSSTNQGPRVRTLIHICIQGI